MNAVDVLPITEVLEPATEEELVGAVRESHDADRAIYPLGGQTSLDFGWPPRKSGVGLATTGLQRVTDYPARDLTITVEAGIPMRRLSELLATERQQLPIDVPQTEQATLGGVVATNFNGPRRFGHGSVRDYVIGISAVDGRGRPFKGGGRVVKNVAGYDFCKLLTGSLGTLGVITQLTLKLKPIAERSAFLVCAPHDLVQADRILAGLVPSRTTPVAVELLAGDRWSGDPALAGLPPPAGREPVWLAVGLEGSAEEVQWMTQQLAKEWWELGVGEQQTLFDADASGLLERCIQFPAAEPAPLLVKASVLPSRLTAFVAAVRELDAQGTVLAHAGNGIVIARLSQVPAGGATKGVIGKLQSAAAQAQGTVVVLGGSGVADPTHRSIWGPTSAPQSLLTAVKQAFDPKNILNPDRFVYAGY